MLERRLWLRNLDRIHIITKGVKNINLVLFHITVKIYRKLFLTKMSTVKISSMNATNDLKTMA